MKTNEYKTIAEIAQCLPGRPSQMAVWRWCRKGLKARCGKVIHMKHIRCGGRLMVRPSDAEKFFDDLAQADLEHFGEEEVIAQGTKAAHARLEAAGL